MQIATRWNHLSREDARENKDLQPASHHRRPAKSLIHLPTLLMAADGESDGVQIVSYGQGQVTGATFTVPAHAQISVDFELQLLCVSPSDVNSLTQMIRGMLDASHQHSFDELQQSSSSGGSSFFGLWNSSSQSTTDTKHTMDSFGLSQANQDKIVKTMLGIVATTNKFSYHGTVFNKDYDYDVTGNIFAIVMDASVKQGSQTQQNRYIAPNAHLTSDDGAASLPVTGKLY